MPDMTTEYEEWLTVEQAGEILELGPRMVNRYGNAPYNRLRTQRIGRRVLYHRDDVQALAEELSAARMYSPPVKTELATIPDATTDRELELEQRVYAAVEEIGRLKGLLESQRLLTGDRDELLQRVGAAEERARRAEEELERMREAQAEQEKRPWWRFW